MENLLGYEDLKKILSDIEPKHCDSYLNSAIYYLVTGRKGAWLYKKENSCVVVCCHPQDERCILIFPLLGDVNHTSLIVKIINDLEITGKRILLSKYVEGEIKLLESIISVNSDDIKINIVAEETMDWRYPVHVLDVQKVATLDGPRFSKVRNKVRRASGITTFSELDSSNVTRLIRGALYFWHGNMIIESKETEDMRGFYDKLIEFDSKHPGDLAGLLFQVGRRPAGFSIWEIGDGETANLFANICDITIVGLSDLQIVKSCETLKDRGFKYLNLGGSEIESLDEFKRKFEPVKSMEFVSALVEYKNRNTMEDIDVYSIAI